jgi:hypothetical protein
MGNQIWWASKTFRKDVGMDAADKPSTSNSNHVKEEEIPEKASDHEEKLELSKWLTVGPPPKPDDCKKDNYVCK